MKTIEDIILQHGQRGMNVLRNHLPADYVRQAADYILSWQKGKVLLFTGFFVAGYAETDGPAGTFALADTLRTLGYTPVIVTDEFCRDFFEAEGFEVVYMPFEAGEEFVQEQLDKLQPVGLISCERCGKNIEGHYANMRGVVIDDKTAAVDLFFTMTEGKVPSVGIGDGGNEIGMGNVADVIKNELSLTPCAVKVDKLVIAAVSNWGAYGLAADLRRVAKADKLPEAKVVQEFLARTVKIGSVDGITHEQILSVDNFPMEVGSAIIEELRAL